MVASEIGEALGLVRERNGSGCQLISAKHEHAEEAVGVSEIIEEDSTMGTAVFPDTNIFLHYRQLDQIDWLDLLKVDVITIVVPPVIARELNHHKDAHSRSHIRDRAGKAINQLAQILEDQSKAEIRPNVTVHIASRDPIIDSNDSKLNPQVQDDHLIASILMWQDEHPNDDAILITSDSGLTLSAKARQQDISVKRLPDDFKLPAEQDPQQARINELEEQIRQLKQSIPDLSLQFPNRRNFYEFEVPAQVELSKEEIDIKLAKVKREYPKLKQSSDMEELGKLTLGDLESDFTKRLLANVNWGDYVSAADVATYNDRLEGFYQDYIDYLKRKVAFENKKRRTISIPIALVNDGTAPARDIDVILRFPTDIIIQREYETMNSPSPPKPPAKPQTTLEKLSGLDSRLLDLDFGTTSPFIPHDSAYFAKDFGEPNVSNFDIEADDNSIVVSFHVGKLKHTYAVSPGELSITFDSHETVRSFEIQYIILAENTPTEIRDVLRIVVKVEAPDTPASPVA